MEARKGLEAGALWSGRSMKVAACEDPEAGGCPGLERSSLWPTVQPHSGSFHPVELDRKTSPKMARALTLGLRPVLQVPSECSSHSASCSPEWGSTLEFGPNTAGK